MYESHEIQFFVSNSCGWVVSAALRDLCTHPSDVMAMLLPPTGSKKENVDAFGKFVQKRYLNTDPKTISNLFKSWPERTQMLKKNNGGAIPR